MLPGRLQLNFKQKVAECKKVIDKTTGFKYFLDTYVYIEDKENKAAIKLQLWPEQENTLPSLVNEKLLVVLKARQLGLTWLVAAYTLWRMITNQMYLAVIVSVTEDLEFEFLERMCFIMDRCPDWMTTAGGVVKTRTKQVLEIQHPNGLTSMVKCLASTSMGAQSKTPNLLVMDEVCKNKLAKDIYNASYPGVEAGKGQVILISNAIKEGSGWFFLRDLYIASMRGMNKFKRIFLPWSAHPGRPANFKELMIQSGMEEREVNENYCDTEEEAITDRNILGVYYAKQMAAARKEGRICSVPHIEDDMVFTAWDLGVDDSTSIWFFQIGGRGGEFRFIDYYENTGMGMSHYAKVLHDKPYIYGDHYMPHDAQKREISGSADVSLSIKEVAERLGIEPIIVVKKARDSQSVMNAIEAGRNILGRCLFDEKKCLKGIACLESYRAEYDDERNCLSVKPLRNWAIHGADAFRTFVAGYEDNKPVKKEKTYKDHCYSGSLGYLGG